jgi:hypothetical protein
MSEETLEYLEQVLSGLRARFASGDKSVEAKLRAVAAKVDQIRLQKDLVKPLVTPVNIGQQLAKLVRRRSCCR